MTLQRVARPAVSGAVQPACDSAVALRGVSRVFGANPALARVTLDIPAGEAVWLRGPNGSGKSTLLQILATMLAPTYGNGAVLGFDLVRDRPQIRRLLEFLGHRTRLYGDLTAEENLRFACRLCGVNPAGIPAALRRVGLAGVADDRVAGFSHGMAQRLALARCWLRQPVVLLLDEPYAGLDESARAAVDDLVARSRDDGRTVVLASHEPPPQPLVSRTVLLDGGLLRWTRAGWSA